MSSTRTQLAEALAILGTLAATARGQQIERLDPPPGYQWASWGEPAISADGSWIGLVISGPGGYAIQRRHGADAEILGAMPMSGVTRLRIANNGQVHCNVIDFSEGVSHEWTSVGPVLLHHGATMNDVSSDGRFQVVHESSPVIYEGRTARTYLDWPFQHGDASASAGNSDLSVVVGQSYANINGQGHVVPLRWRGIRHQLLPLAGRPDGVTEDVSPDGSVISGRIGSWPSSEPAIWIGDSDPLVIGIPGGAGLITAEGRFVVLSLQSGNAVWTPFGGVRSFTELGFPSNSFNRFHIASASDDGTRLLAWRNNLDRPDEMGWVLVTLPPPCPLDYATDGFVDFFDYVAFVACFEGECPNYRSADFNMDGFVDWADYAGFVEAFEIGC